jgi:hypothetical protein
MSYAIDGVCHNAEAGTYGHECGQPAVWTAESTNGFRFGVCARCRAEGDEVRGMHGWQPYNRPREIMIAINRNHRTAGGWIDEGAMSAMFDTYDLPPADRVRIWRELTKNTAFDRVEA